MLSSVLADNRIKSVEAKFGAIEVTNIWNDRFQIEPVTLFSGQVAAHATLLHLGSEARVQYTQGQIDRQGTSYGDLNFDSSSSNTPSNRGIAIDETAVQIYLSRAERAMAGQSFIICIALCTN
jgi:hypothetical protein